MRTIRYQRRVAEAIDAAGEKWAGAEDVWNAMEWTLARDPTVGAPLNEPGTVRTYMIQGAKSVGWPTATAIYKIESEDVIVIEDAQFEEAGIYQAGHA